MAKVLVTGGAGYVGSHVVYALSEAGHDVVVVDDLSTGDEYNLRGMDILCHDYTSHDMLKSLKRVDILVHCAALTDAANSVKRPSMYYTGNVVKLMELLFMMRGEVKKMIFSSSAAVYDTNVSPPYAEDSPVKPCNPYGETKLIGENMLKYVGMKYTALRYFNVAGADKDLRCGPSLGSNSLFSNIMRAVTYDSNVPMYRASTGRMPLRDFIHPTDLARAHVKAVEARLVEDAPSATYNVGNGMSILTSDVFNAFKKQYPKLQCVRMDHREGDIDVSWASIDLIRKELEWKPTMASNLDNMVSTMYKWHEHKLAVSAGLS